ncbi:hypothetical protein K437DRAFT_14304 [Tilletiaria anomala UBC 951]|uniref:Uncharacterized protein n=1 Tax=Tilletiaria anomala (strain ATCC 24038 / CBS 436.72 / UBC 951) TaxID=1037660 RepID=A0A066VKQ6_TILAU|nr:uncharacterized protein K437DRAFT_14304 [Tilletiaria anomala UBC 951]KDN39170.1 hypothetical protein K437DRAFT_14304 [Tilletiaria anomala UBC 951]
MTSSVRTAYSSLVVLVAASGSRSNASTPLQGYVKHVFGATVEEAEKRLARDTEKGRRLRDLDLFLRSKKTHAELLVRYNPTHDLTEQERVRMTARRVGLDVPDEYRGESKS